MEAAQECCRSSWMVYGKGISSAWQERLLLLLSAELLSQHTLCFKYLMRNCFKCSHLIFKKMLLK